MKKINADVLTSLFVGLKVDLEKMGIDTHTNTYHNAAVSHLITEK